MTKVQIYSTTWCGYCKAEKKFLDGYEVKYEDIDVEQDPVAAKFMIETSGQMGVPFTLITREDGSKAGRVGFDQVWLKQELKLA
jgi:glutaredoxin 3